MCSGPGCSSGFASKPRYRFGQSLPSETKDTPKSKKPPRAPPSQDSPPTMNHQDNRRQDKQVYLNGAQ